MVLPVFIHDFNMLHSIGLHRPDIINNTSPRKNSQKFLIVPHHSTNFQKENSYNIDTADLSVFME